VAGGIAGGVLRKKGKHGAARALGLVFLGLCVVKGTEPGGRRKFAEFRSDVAATP
jgi:hypothetical protein